MSSIRSVAGWVCVTASLVACGPSEEVRQAMERVTLDTHDWNNPYIVLPGYPDSLTLMAERVRQGEIKPSDVSREIERLAQRFKERFPEESAALRSTEDSLRADRDAYGRRERERQAEQRTKACMEGEYRNAYRDGQSIEEGRTAAIVECAHLISP